MSQTWQNLLFLHFPVEPSHLRPLVPEYLTVETYEGMAWVGVVLFEMRNVRFAGTSKLLAARSFPEFNVRTYVNRDGEEAGVYFFSLDAASAPAVRIARRFFHLPYFRSMMSIETVGGRVSYTSSRNKGEAVVRGHCRIGDLGGTADPGTFDHFLVERYLFHAVDDLGRRYLGRVHHEPYRLRPVVEFEMHQTLTDASGIAGRDFIHATFCDGVDVTADWLVRT